MRRKSRLTITLPNELLKTIDATIDGSIIRNRSHAIESLIHNSLQNPMEYAVILTGGDRHPDNPALKLLGNQPLINLTLSRLASSGVKVVIICLGLDGESIRQAVGDGRQWGIKIIYIFEDRPTGSGGALKKAEKHIHSEHFLLLHGDVLCDVNLLNFFKFHIQEETIATILVKPRIGGKTFGKVMIEGNQITDFFEKTDSKGIDIINTGVYCCQNTLLRKLPAKTCNLEREIFPLLAKDRQLTAFLFQGLWFDISTPKDYQAALKVWPTAKK